VHDRDDLLLAAFDLAMREFEWPSAELGWRELLTSFADAMWRFLASHPGMAEATQIVPGMPQKALDLADTYVARLRAEGLSSRDAVIAVDYTADLTVAAEIGVRRMSRVFSTPRGERSLRELYDAPTESQEPLGGADRFARRGWLDDKLAILLDGLANRLGEQAAGDGAVVKVVPSPLSAAPDRAAITSVGRALARRGGLAAVSVHAVAEELGTTVTAVRRVIGDRDGIVVAMLDALADELVVPPSPQEPRTEIIAILTALQTTLLTDRWALPAVTVDGLTGPRVVPVLERLFHAFRAAGVPDEDVAAATRVCWEHVCGAVLCQQPRGTFAMRVIESAGLAVPMARDGGVLGLSVVVDGLLARLS
jgi:AcrR family transcriptional regulator